MLSIIIPIYNGEKHIKNCIDSIFNSKFKDYELILVDDGSTDNTKEILKQYEKYDNIKVFNISHRGLCETRNFGLTKAQGEFVTFIDVDDKVLNYDYIEIEDSDVLVFSYIRDFENEGYQIPSWSYDKEYVDAKEFLNDLYNSDLLNPTWNKIYRKDLISEMKFDDKYYQHEDLAFNIEVASKIKKAKIISDTRYIYMIRNTVGMSNKYVENYEVILNNKLELFKKFLNDDQFANAATYQLETYVINLFKNNKYNFISRNKMIKDIVLTHYEIIKKAKMLGIYSKIFKFIALSKSSTLINISYGIFTFLKNNLGTIYFKIRKTIYKNEVGKYIRDVYDKK